MSYCANCDRPTPALGDEYCSDTCEKAMEECCTECGGELPPLDGTEKNDFAHVCLECQAAPSDFETEES